MFNQLGTLVHQRVDRGIEVPHCVTTVLVLLGYDKTIKQGA
jgi:hypothetical protein